MIEGTKPYKKRGRVSAAENSETATAPPAAEAAVSTSASDPAAQTLGEQRSAPPAEGLLGRRDWFRSLVPAFGSGLVEILRASNNLKRDLKETRDGK